jgi:hypothetical protein
MCASHAVGGKALLRCKIGAVACLAAAGDFPFYFDSFCHAVSRGSATVQAGSTAMASVVRLLRQSCLA